MHVTFRRKVTVWVIAKKKKKRKDLAWSSTRCFETTSDSGVKQQQFGRQ